MGKLAGGLGSVQDRVARDKTDERQDKEPVRLLTPLHVSSGRRTATACFRVVTIAPDGRLTVVRLARCRGEVARLAWALRRKLVNDGTRVRAQRWVGSHERGIWEDLLSC
jgi:hypothetical protein